MEIYLGKVKTGSSEYGSIDVLYDVEKKQFILTSNKNQETLVFSYEEMKSLFEELDRINRYKQ